MWAERIRTAESQGMESVIESTMAIWFTAEFRARAHDAVDRVRRMFRATDAAGYVATIRAIAAVDLTASLPAIRCPALVLVGEKDPGTPVVMARVIHEGIAGSKLVILPGAMHCSSVEAEEAFNAAVLPFLGAVA
jgi:pimeloyl-ACP methyl ester carboxylesterase